MSGGLSRCRLRFWYFVEESVSYLLVVQPANVSFRAISRPNECLEIHYGGSKNLLQK